MRDSVIQTIVKNCICDQSIYLLLGDLGVHQAAEGIRGIPRQVVNYGIREASMVSFATGLSLAGSYPFLYSINPFLTERALEHLKNGPLYQETGICLVTAGGTCDYSRLGYTHFCPNDIEYLWSVGIEKVYMPFNKSDAVAAVNSLVDTRLFGCIRLSNEELSPKDLIEGKTSLTVFVGPDSLILEERSQESDEYYMKEVSKEEITKLARIVMDYDFMKLVCGFNAATIAIEVVQRISDMEKSIEIRLKHIPLISSKRCGDKATLLKSSCSEVILQKK